MNFDSTVLAAYIRNNLIADFDTLYDDLDDEEIFKEKRTRNRQESVDLWSTGWGKMLSNDAVKDPESFVGRKFRRRFRVPHVLFIKIKELCEQRGIFRTKKRSPIPIDFKILIALRILARGNCCDDLNEFSNIGESTCNFIFKNMKLVLDCFAK